MASAPIDFDKSWRSMASICALTWCGTLQVNDGGQWNISGRPSSTANSTLSCMRTSIHS